MSCYRALLLWLSIGLGLTACSPRYWVNHPPAAPVGYYIVQRGDTLYSIAWRTGHDYRTLASWNHIRQPYQIYPGQKLRVVPVRSDRPPVNSVDKSARRKSPTSPAPNSQPEQTGPVRWQWPTQGSLIKRFASSGPGKKGIDIGGRMGQSIVAASAGHVVYTGSGLIGYGKLIIVKHNDEYLSAYGHNRQLLVEEGQQVRAGQRIAEMGATGTDRPRLHFEIRRDGEPVDPLTRLPRVNGR